MTNGQNYVNAILDTAAKYAAAVAEEMRLEDNRHAIKYGAIERLMRAGDNPLTGKPHSFSSAEAMVTHDAEYTGYLSQLRDASVARILARGAHDAALASARLAAGDA